MFPFSEILIQYCESGTQALFCTFYFEVISNLQNKSAIRVQRNPIYPYSHLDFANHPNNVLYSKMIQTRMKCHASLFYLFNLPKSGRVPQFFCDFTNCNISESMAVVLQNILQVGFVFPHEQTQAMDFGRKVTKTVSSHCIPSGDTKCQCVPSLATTLINCWRS